MDRVRLARPDEVTAGAFVMKIVPREDLNNPRKVAMWLSVAAELDPKGAQRPQFLQAYEAVRAELDRLDPGGAPRRSAATLALVERLKQALATQK